MIEINNSEVKTLGADAVSMLRKLVSIPAYSTHEILRSDFISKYLYNKGVVHSRIKNNIVAYSKYFDPSKPTLMLNSHIDTVRESDSYTFDPFNPPYSESVIFGLGSNDAGASLVSAIHAFLFYYEKRLPFNLLLALSCEEEISGPNGMDLIVEEIKNIDCAIIGEPTGMKVATAERGLLVLDGTAIGKSGHAARNEGINALYIALEDIAKLRNFKFEKISERMGEVKLTVTQIEAGRQHNVVPEICKFVVDIRPTEQYSNKEVLDILQAQVKSKLTPRSLTNRSSATPLGHPLLNCADSLAIGQYTSPTTSDWMRIDIPAIKMGPGESSRSHQADEYVLVDELLGGVAGYIRFIANMEF